MKFNELLHHCVSIQGDSAAVVALWWSVSCPELINDMLYLIISGNLPAVALVFEGLRFIRLSILCQVVTTGGWLDVNP